YPLKDHPVESDLRKAGNCVLESGLEEFKEHRKNVLNYLEWQYCKIHATRRYIIAFIKEQKVVQGLFDADRVLWNPYHYLNDRIQLGTAMSIGLLLLQDYATAYVRKIPFDNRALRIRYKRKLEKVYSLIEREVALSALDDHMAEENLKRYIYQFKIAFHDMEKQYAEIQNARRSLFKADGSKHLGLGGGFLFQDTRSEDAIDRAVNEPTPEEPKFDQYLDRSR
ncbi:hypothetical protein BDZ45DRAFT_604361, partial [Acephala macrosclerotiorum]